MTPLDPNDPRTLNAERYNVLGILGEGAMGRTYLAEDSQTQTRLAIKALYPSRLATIKDLEMFQREASVLQRLDHPQIPKYLDAFHEGEGESMCYFLAQEYVQGKTLRELIDSGTRFDDDAFIELAENLLSVLSYLHTCNPPVVHRDVKPANIIIRPDGKPTLVDFGAVREVVRLTMGGGSTIIGTYGYMPPEQLMGRSMPGTDVYAAGVTLVECLTRQTPSDLLGEDIKRLIASVQGSDNLKRLLARMCAPGTNDRFASAADALDDLRGLKGGVLVHTAKLEQEIEKREMERNKSLKRSSVQRSHVGYVIIVAFIITMAVVAIFYIGQAVLTGFGTSTIVAIALGAFGLWMNVSLVGLRVVHDAWEAPAADWIKATATVNELKYEQVLDENGNLRPIYVLHYRFRVSGNFKDFSRVISVQEYKVLSDARDEEAQPKRIQALIDFVLREIREEHGVRIVDPKALKRIEDAVIDIDQKLRTDTTVQVLYISGLVETPTGREDFRKQMTRKIWLEIAPIPDILPKGTEFDVWYPSGRPEHHDLQDVRRPSSSVMRTLFDHRVVHTPE